MEKVPVSQRAVVARVNRRLAPDGEKMRVYRGGRWASNLGRYYIVNFNRNFIIGTNLDLEGYARELGVLADYEALEEE